MTSIPLQGSLTDTPLPKLLLDLYRDNYSGGLALELQRTRKKILFFEGAPVAAESDLASETLCGQLTGNGTLSDEDARQVAQAMEKKGYDERSAVLALGLINPRDLLVALKELLRRRTIACFGWSSGSYALLPNEAPDESIQPLRADPIALVQEGLEKSWSVDRMLEALASRMNQFPVASRALSGALLRLRTDEVTDGVVAQLNGKNSLADVLAGAVRSPRALAATWVIDASGLLRYRDTAVAESEDGEEPEVEIEITGVFAEPAPVASASPAAAASAVGSNAEKAGAMRLEIQDRIEQLAELNYYELLEIDRKASAGVVKKAYFKAAKRYHPDSLARLSLESLKTQAAAVFSRMAEAYEVLGDSQKRAEYDSSLDNDGPEIDTASLAQAETFFRKGEILAKMGDFRGALQFLENAVQLWPKEAAYQSALGWSLYKKNPPEPERAREHLGHALGLDPKDAVTYFRMSLVLRALGDEEAASRSLARAKQLDPSASEAR